MTGTIQLSTARGTVMTVLGEIRASAMGITLPHEHIFNDMLGALSPPAFGFSEFLAGEQVRAENLWALRHDPYACRDNLLPRSVDDALTEIMAFKEVGGRTIVDATGSPSIGRDPERLREVARMSGVHIVMATGPYLEKIEKERIVERDTDALTEVMVAELRDGVGDNRIRAGVIGEIGVSPAFTASERKVLRAACNAQREYGDVGINIHMPGWERRGGEVLDIVLDEMEVDPSRVSLAHSDPSGSDIDYQRSLLERGVWLEFDMIGLDISFPGEGPSPSAVDTARHVSALIEEGYEQQLLLSHDLFLKQMLSAYGGNGLRFIPTVFVKMLRAHGVSAEMCLTLLTDNPRNFLSSR